MSIIDQNRFLSAARVAKGSGSKSDWDQAANILSGLGMGDILPALATLDPGARESIRWGASRALVRSASRRIEFAVTAVSERVFERPDDDLPKDQVDEVRRYVVAAALPKNSQAKVMAFASADAAAIRAIAEISPATAAARVEFSGSIYKSSGIRFTPPKMGGASGSEAAVPVPQGTTRVASYHTHPANNPNAENFSPEDIAICRGLKHGNVVLVAPVISYLGTPSGHVKKLTPPALLQGKDAELYGLLGKPELVK